MATVEKRTVLVRLPYPPSVNKHWRSHKGRVLISAEGRAYRKQVEAVVAGRGVGKCEGRLAVAIRAVMPDRRGRDLDNVLKATLDALEKAGVFDDDEQIDDLRILRGRVDPPGYLDVRIVELGGQGELFGESDAR